MNEGVNEWGHSESFRFGIWRSIAMQIFEGVVLKLMLLVRSFHIFFWWLQRYYQCLYYSRICFSLLCFPRLSLLVFLPSGVGYPTKLLLKDSYANSLIARK